jgi:hypothetical protein
LLLGLVTTRPAAVAVAPEAAVLVAVCPGASDVTGAADVALVAGTTAVIDGGVRVVVAPLPFEGPLEHAARPSATMLAATRDPVRCITQPYTLPDGIAMICAGRVRRATAQM